MEDLLSQNKIKQDGIFNPVAVEQLKSEHLNGTANHSHILWAMIVFQDWKKRWLEGEALK
jgi:asparagine synthase (glutamine-hydrolysing)